MELRLSNLAKTYPASGIRKMFDLAAGYNDVIALTLGEPNFETPAYIKEAAKKAIDDNFSRYSPVPGYMDLRKAIVAKLKNENHLDYTTSEILVSNGAKQSVCNTVMALVNDGEEVIIPAPYWVSYPQMVKLAGGTPVIVNAGFEQEFKMKPEQLEAAITPKTRMLILCSPSNPTGSVYTKDELAALADPTTTSLTASVQAYDGTLKHGKMYTIVGGGYIKYMTKYGLVQQPEDIGESISRKTFTYNGRSAEPVLSDSMPEAMLDYQEERADWIFQKFEMNPDDYNYAWFYELSSYVGTDAFVTIFDIIDLPAGATSDSYFVNNAMDTVYCVFQDKDAVNYLYEFTKEDDVWQLSKVETRQDEGKYSETQQSYADYEQQLLGA